MTIHSPCPEGRERCAVDGVECECERVIYEQQMQERDAMADSQTTGLEQGYYWVRDKGNPSMMIREWVPDCGSSGLWFIAGIDGGVEPDRVEVLSGKIEEPGDAEGKRVVAGVIGRALDLMVEKDNGIKQLTEAIKDRDQKIERLIAERDKFERAWNDILARYERLLSQLGATDA